MNSVQSPTCCGSSGEKRLKLTALAKWSLPSAALLLVPKCPLCVMACAAAAGLSISVTTAAGIRLTAITACFVALAYFTIRLFRNPQT